MAETVLKDTRFWLGALELTGSMNETRLDLARVLKDRTVFGEDTISFKAGVKQVNAVHGGFWNAPQPDSRFNDNWDGAFVQPVTIAVSSTVGDPAYIFLSREVKYALTGKFGDMLGFQVEFQAGDSPVGRGSLMFVKTSTTGENGTAVQVGAVSATQTLYMVTHLTAFTGTDVTINIDRDDNSGMTTAVEHGDITLTTTTFNWTAITDITTDDWWRIRIGGTYSSATLAISLAIIDN